MSGVLKDFTPFRAIGVVPHASPAAVQAAKAMGADLARPPALHPEQGTAYGPLLYDGELEGVFGIWSEGATWENGRPIAAEGHSIDADKVIASMDTGAYRVEAPVIATEDAAHVAFDSAGALILGKGHVPILGGFYVCSPKIAFDLGDPMLHRDRFQPGGKGAGGIGFEDVKFSGVSGAGIAAGTLTAAGVASWLGTILGSGLLSAIGSILASLGSGFAALLSGIAAGSATAIAGAIYGTMVGVEASVLGVEIGASLASMAAGGAVGLAAAAIVGGLLGLSAALQPRNPLDLPHLKSVSGHFNMRAWYETPPVLQILSVAPPVIVTKPSIASTPFPGSDDSLIYDSPQEELLACFPAYAETILSVGTSDRLYPFANAKTVDRWTWFAGLTKLVTSVTQPDSLARDDAVDCAWVQRVPDEGIAAFRRARAHGDSISEAIRAAIPSIDGTVFEGNRATLEALADKHRSNEQYAFFNLHDMSEGSAINAFASLVDAETLRLYQVSLGLSAGIGDRYLKTFRAPEAALGAIKSMPVFQRLVHDDVLRTAQGVSFSGLGDKPVDPTMIPPHDGAYVVTASDVKDYADWLTLRVADMTRAVDYWSTDPGVTTLGVRVILAAAGWEVNLGLIGPWQSWEERWRELYQGIQTHDFTPMALGIGSVFVLLNPTALPTTAASVTGTLIGELGIEGNQWEYLKARHKELASFAKLAEDAGLPKVPDMGKIPTSPWSFKHPGIPEGLQDDLDKAGKGAIDFMGIVTTGALIIGGAIVLSKAMK